MWWLTIPVVVYAAGLLVLWIILVRRGENTGPADRSLPEESDVRISDHVDTPVVKNVPVFASGRAGLPGVSVIVAARNEEKQITALLDSFVYQDYPRELYEVIIVNDNSTDRTPIVVSEFIEALDGNPSPRIRLIYNPFSGKKRAVRYGIEKAYGEVVVTTDADCIVGPSWVRSHAGWYMAGHCMRQGEDEGMLREVFPSVGSRQGSDDRRCGPDMVLAGVVQRAEGGFWSQFGVYEFSALQALTEATALLGHPVMCNAANMSFRRDVYLRHINEIRPELPSGDDMFLMEAVMRDGGTVRHDGRRAAAVETAAAVTAAALLRQRARWASKALHLSNPYTLILAAATAACNAAVTAAAVIACTAPENIPLTGVMYGIKTVPDYLLIAGEMHRRGNPVKLLTFIASELLYPFYFLLVGIISIFPSAKRFRPR